MLGLLVFTTPFRGITGGRQAGGVVKTMPPMWITTVLGTSFLVVGILTLNIADAFFTLQWVGRGGSEGNPLMEWVLENGGTGAFVIQKCLLVGFWLLLLVVHKNFKIARIGLWTLLALYSTLLLYHLFLYFFGVPIPPVSA